MFGFKSHTDRSQRETEERPRAFSRREFLASIAGAAALLGTGSLRAETLNQEGGEPGGKEGWETVRAQGIARLKDAALAEKDEQVAFFIRDANGSRWEDFGATGGATYSSIPLPNVEEALAAPSAYLEVFHTHPLDTILRGRGVAIEDVPQPEPSPMPPSFTDVVSVIQIKSLLKEKGDRFAESVVDPVGTWSYGIDSENPLMRELQVAIRSLQDMANRITPDMLEEAEGIAKRKGVAGGDPRLLGFLLIQNVDALSPGLQKLIRESAAPFFDLAKSRTMQEFMAAADFGFATKDLRKPSERADLIEVYRRAGVVLSFVPHPDAAVDRNGG